MTQRRRVLLAYVSYPATTARYLEASLRRRHDVVTIGPVIDESLVQAWNLQHLREPAVPHDLPCGLEVDVAAAAARLNERFDPELFLWVESVPGYRPRHIPRLDCPTACYLIDTHLHMAAHLDWAAQFDWVFLAQREYVEAFRAEGLKVGFQICFDVSYDDGWAELGRKGARLVVWPTASPARASSSAASSPSWPDPAVTPVSSLKPSGLPTGSRRSRI